MFSNFRKICDLQNSDRRNFTLSNSKFTEKAIVSNVCFFGIYCVILQIFEDVFENTKEELFVKALVGQKCNRQRLDQHFSGNWSYRRMKNERSTRSMDLKSLDFFL